MPSPGRCSTSSSAIELRPAIARACSCRAAPRSAPPLKDGSSSHLPTLIIVDGLGSSEAGGQLAARLGAGADATTGTFAIGPGNHVLVSRPRSRSAAPATTSSAGWPRAGGCALGYLGDAAKTRAHLPGDRRRPLLGARRPGHLRADGVLELHGRDSVTINSGGEKIFAEEVEAAIKAHPDVYDCVVAGRPSERWGNEVVAVVQLRDGCDADEAALLAEAATHIARYKLPEGVRVRRRGRALAIGQGRLPLGQANRRQRPQRECFRPFRVAEHSCA